MTAADFAPHVDTAFDIEGVRATLAELEERDTPEAFSLYFRGPTQPVLEQRTYTLTHEAMGTLEIFLVPVQLTEAGMLYEAVFN